MKSVKCYLCTVTLQNPGGGTMQFVLPIIAGNSSEAISIANGKATESFPPDWERLGTVAVALKTAFLEEVAERVLGWSRPTSR